VAYLAFPNATVDFTRFNADDSGFYLALAESLADGRGYTFYQEPLYAPSNFWPPALPLGLSAVIRMFGLRRAKSRSPVARRRDRPPGACRDLARRPRRRR
jgi:hypothetical protein